MAIKYVLGVPSNAGFRVFHEVCTEKLCFLFFTNMRDWLFRARRQQCTPNVRMNNTVFPDELW